MSLDHLVFMRRRSPDWSGLARDYEAGMPIEAPRYEPSLKVPGFPNDIVACVQAWNDTFPVNFFRCRQVLKEISEHSIRQIKRAMIVSEDKLGEWQATNPEGRFLLFFFDDDDWFAPDTYERLSALNPGPAKVAVFPLVRFGLDSFTFVRQDQIARLVVGSRRNFGHRFQTNNYGISHDIALSGHLPHMKDHVLASMYADQKNLCDIYYDIIISATNKTPCSANTIGALPSDQPAYRAFLRRYVVALQGLQIPRDLDWMSRPLQQTVELFSRI